MNGRQLHAQRATADIATDAVSTFVLTQAKEGVLDRLHVSATTAAGAKVDPELLGVRITTGNRNYPVEGAQYMSAAAFGDVSDLGGLQLDLPLDNTSLTVAVINWGADNCRVLLTFTVRD